MGFDVLDRSHVERGSRRVGLCHEVREEVFEEHPSAVGELVGVLRPRPVVVEIWDLAGEDLDQRIGVERLLYFFKIRLLRVGQHHTGQRGDDRGRRIVDFKDPYPLDGEGDVIRPCPVLLEYARMAGRFRIHVLRVEIKLPVALFHPQIRPVRSVDEFAHAPLRLLFPEHRHEVVHVRREEVPVLFSSRPRRHEVHHVKGYRPAGDVVPPDDRTPVNRQSA